MSFADSVQSDFRVVDATFAATFTAIRAGGSTPYSLTGVDSQDLSVREIGASEGFYQIGDRRFFLPNVLITDAAHKPQPGDTVTVGAVVWRLLDAVLDAFGISWGCIARKSR